jgi:soluble lytic murein transglycosylase
VRGDDAGTSSTSPDEPLGIDVVLDDPRMRLARDRYESGDAPGAAAEMDRVLAGAALGPKQACTFRYMAGRMHLAAGDSEGAVTALHEVSDPADGASPPCELAGYARLREAQALYRLGRFDESLAAAQSAGELSVRDEVALARADALAGMGDRKAAISIWRSLLAASPHGLRWVDTSMQLARALLDGVDGAPESRAQEASELATRVLIEAPAVAQKVDAVGLRQRAAAVRKRGSAEPLSLSDRVHQAQAWADASQPKRAREVADDVLREAPGSGKEQAPALCKAAVIRAQATPRKPEDAARAWSLAIALCRDDEALPTALYQGAKASAAAKRVDEALARFEEVERRFPKNRLADDSRYRSALLVADQGDAARSVAMLSSLADTYPEGDMAGDALFRVALDKIDRRELAEARAVLDRILTLPGGILSGSGAARAEYFRARVAQLAGEVDDAKARYAKLVGARPLSYYMLLAFARLKALDEAQAAAAWNDLIAREPAGTLWARDRPEFSSPAFGLFTRLLEVGEIDAARREASAAGLAGDSTDPEVLWATAWLYERAGAPEIGHAFSRSRLIDYRAHWPAGRWRLAWEVAFPRPWESIVLRESESAHVPAALTWAIMREESAFNPEARSSASAVGLMQLMQPTARLVAQGPLGRSVSPGDDAGTWPVLLDEDALRRPDLSVALGVRLLSSLRGSFPGRPALAIAAYNGGTVAVRRWLNERGGLDFDVFVERIAFDETRNYVKRVLSSQAAYAALYAPDAMGELLCLL